ncbi:anaerobic ribonucleoside-triphosphate reductase activating protein [Patescibacteria group bacterium]|jgi:pyruvate formate lyase activating enzyme|nr:anaerobic ribonucleoside-triphosphate reductase activating protein [Patescibacteria group bacterium]
MKFSAIQPFTVLDYPGKAACIAFTPGCNFRCGYCHNPEFVLPDRVKLLEPDFIDEETVIGFLERRKGLLDGIVVTGGEPTLHRGLPDFLRRVKSLGFLVKLDTNGSLPQVVGKLFDENLLDYVAMDVKTSLEQYPGLVGPCIQPKAIQDSIDLIRDHAPDYEFRTTLLREVHGLPVLKDMIGLVARAKRYVLQPFRSAVTLDPNFGSYSAPDASEMELIIDLFRPHVGELILR